MNKIRLLLDRVCGKKFFVGAGCGVSGIDLVKIEYLKELGDTEGDCQTVSRLKEREEWKPPPSPSWESWRNYSYLTQKKVCRHRSGG